jgi:hypothetical protein
MRSTTIDRIPGPGIDQELPERLRSLPHDRPGYDPLTYIVRKLHLQVLASGGSVATSGLLTFGVGIIEAVHDSYLPSLTTRAFCTAIVFSFLTCPSLSSNLLPSSHRSPHQLAGRHLSHTNQYKIATLVGDLAAFSCNMATEEPTALIARKEPQAPIATDTVIPLPNTLRILA